MIDDDIPGDINPDPDDDGGYWCRFLDEPCWGECHMGYARCPHEPDEPQDNCAHEWAYTGTAYGGDDPRWFGEGRRYCIHCGADGDA